LGPDASSEQFYEYGGFWMGVVLLIIVAVVVLVSIGVKVRRGSFFRWGQDKGGPTS
jgi:uncharacterized membrane protein